MVDKLTFEEEGKLLFFEPDELFLFLDEQEEKESSIVEQVKGRSKEQNSHLSKISILIK